ncbi:MAG: DMT family transporter [Burkholderiales bacterium]
MSEGTPASLPSRAWHAAPWVGPACAALGVFGFSFKGIFIKLAYAAAPVDAITLLALRMLYSVPLFAAMAWWSARRPGSRPLAAKDLRQLAWFGFIGYYLASLLDFMGLQYITASLERLVMFLYPTMVVLLSALLLGKRVTGRAVLALALSYAGIAIVFWQDLRLSADAGATLAGGALTFGSAALYALYLVQAGPVIARLTSPRFIAWAMLASTMFVLAQFVATRPLSALAVPAYVHLLSIGMAVFATVVPTWLIAESVQRMGANAASLVGALGPVFTAALGALILGEAFGPVQIAGGALVLAGVLLVTTSARGIRGAGA